MADRHELAARIDAYLKEHRDEIVRDLMELVKVPSIVSAAAPGAPFGEEVLKSLEKASEMFEREGLESKIYGGKYALAKYGKGDKKIGLFGHCDVVPVSDDWIYTTPFAPIEKDGCLIGRGIEDNKAGVIMTLYLVKILKELGIELDCALDIFMGGQEETGMEDVEAYKKEHKMPDMSIVPDGMFPVCYGEKGMCKFWVISPKAFEAVKSVKGGNAYNVVLDDVLTVFEKNDALLAELKEKTKGMNAEISETADGIALRVKGLSQHASTPEGSINAAHLTAKLLKDVKALPENDRRIFETAEYFLDGYYGEHYGIAQTDTVFGKLTCVNGMIDIVDGTMRFSWDIRCGTQTDLELMQKNIRQSIEGKGWVCDIRECGEGFLLDKNGAPLKMLKEVYRDISGDKNAEGFVMAGGTYARRLENAYSVGTQVPYIKVNLEMAPGHGGAHQCDEAVNVQSLLEAIKILTLMVIECDKTI